MEHDAPHFKPEYLPLPQQKMETIEILKQTIKSTASIN